MKHTPFKDFLNGQDLYTESCKLFHRKLRKTNRKTYHAHELENNTVKMSISLKLNLRFNTQTHP